MIIRVISLVPGVKGKDRNRIKTRGAYHPMAPDDESIKRQARRRSCLDVSTVFTKFVRTSEKKLVRYEFKDS